MENRLRLDLVTSEISENDQGTLKKMKISQMVKQSLSLQNEIEQLFEEYESNNKEIREDVDDFCEIYESSMGNITMG